jgi:hypothetical protein
MVMMARFIQAFKAKRFFSISNFAPVSAALRVAVL